MRLRRVVAVVLGTLVLAAACVAEGPDIEISDLAAGAGTSTTVQLDSTVGRTVRTPSGNDVVAKQVVGASDGSGRIAVEFEACANPSATKSAGVNPTHVALELSDGRLALTRGSPLRTPALTAQEVRPGECASGWIGYLLPDDVTAIAVVLRGSSLVRWAIQ